MRTTTTAMHARGPPSRARAKRVDGPRMRAETSTRARGRGRTMGVTIERRRSSCATFASDRSEGERDDTLTNLDKLLGEFERTPREETRETPTRARAADAEAKAEGARVAADLAAAQRRIAREKMGKPMGMFSGDKKPKKLVNPEEEYDFSERAIAALVYMLPLLDSLKYSKFLLLQFPVFGLALLPISPIIGLWFKLGFLQIAVFFGTYLGVVQNQNMKRFVRFNAQQAVLLDIILIIPDLLTRTFQGIDGSGPTGGAGLQAEIIFFNSVFLFTYICCVVGAVGSTAGKEIKLPLIGDAAEMQQPR